MLENKAYIIKQISLVEDSVLELKTVEFSSDKITGPHRNSMADELAAMANTHTGVVLLGVDDKSKTIHGSQTRSIRFDEQTVLNAKLNDLDPKLWKRFRTVISPTDDQEFLKKMKLISGDEENVLCPTVSGVLMANDAPESFIRSTDYHN